MGEEEFSQDSRSISGWRRAKNLGRSFFVFLSASCLFNFGMFMFVLLYNLYLLDIGYKEDFIGWMSSATTAGNMIGTVFAVILSRRIGLQRSVIVCFAATATIAAMRSLVVGRGALLALAFAAGLFFAVWAISITVIVAQATTAEMRPLAFSVYLSTVIGIGIIAEPTGGHLPLWLNYLFGPTGAAQSKQWALLLSAAIVSLAVWPTIYLGLPQPAKDARASYPRSSFVLRFLIAVAVLNIATASFNPFANTYFANYLKMPTQHIGYVFSGSQLAQVIAIVLSPLILRKFGMIWGVVSMELAAAFSLATLATGPPVLLATLAFAGYMSFQWMDEPAMESLLMTRVEPHERSGASAMMYMVIFASGALAAPVAGAGLARFGYPPIVVAASFLLLLGALLYGFLLRRSDGETT
ncbi:MAG TPA: MFS transporter [Pyrinomonadaceae bacterium]|nr:MFS transporter [Pyrinomonadaceae bacterium]